MEVPDRLELDVSGMVIGDTLRLADLPPREGVTYLDDPEETVLATVTMPTRIVEPEPEEGEELPEGEEVPEGEEAPEGEARRPRRSATRPAGLRAASPAPPRSSPCACFVGARAPRRSTCSSRGSAIPGREYERTRHNVGWMVSTSWRGGTAASWRAKFSGQLAEMRLDGAAARAGQAGDVHERVGALDRGGAAVLQGSGRRRCLSSTTTSTSTRAASRPAAGGGLAGHNGLRSIAQALGSQDFLRLRIGVGRPGRGDRRSVADYVLSPFEAEVDVDALVGARRMRSRLIVREGLEAAQHASTEHEPAPNRHSRLHFRDGPARYARRGWRVEPHSPPWVGR